MCYFNNGRANRKAELLLVAAFNMALKVSISLKAKLEEAIFVKGG